MSPSTVLAGPLEYFDRLQATFAAATQGESIERCVDAGGVRVRLRLASPAIAAALTPALAHRFVDGDGDVSLTISAFDAVSTGVELPPTPWTTADYYDLGSIAGFNDDRFRTAFPFHASSLSMFDRARDAGVFATRDIDGVPVWEHGAPFLTLFHWGLARHGVHLAHAAVVGTDRGGILLGGRGGSGKSTTALAALTRGLRYVSDDYCLVTTSPAPTAFSLYCTAKITANSRRLLPELECFAVHGLEAPEGKTLFFLSSEYARAIPGRLPLRVIAFPRVSNQQRTTWEGLSPAAALRLLAPSTVLQLGERSGATFERLAALTSQTPAYTLHVGTDMDGVVAALERLIAENE